MEYGKLKLYIEELSVSCTEGDKGHKSQWLINHKLSLNKLRM